jgi:hypothetical protein
MQVRGVGQRLLKGSREPRLFGRYPLRAFNFARILPKPPGYTGDGGGSKEQAVAVDGHGAGHRRLGRGARGEIREIGL